MQYKMDFDNKIFRLSKNVLKRYEPNIANGTYFLFDASNKNLWTGNYSTKILLDLVDGYTETKIIKNEFAKILETTDIGAVNNSVNVIFSDLIEKDFLKEV